MNIIDNKLLIKSGLPFYQFIVLTTLYHEDDDLLQHINFPGKSTKQILKELEELQYVKILSDDYSDIELRKKSYDLFNQSQINFDEFWDNFPIKTLSGRSLRASNKTFHGKLTNDYIKCKKKYLSKVKSLGLHNAIVNIVKAKVKYGSASDKHYENGIEVYINQSKWERDEKFLRQNNSSFGGVSI